MSNGVLLGIVPRSVIKLNLEGIFFKYNNSLQSTFNGSKKFLMLLYMFGSVVFIFSVSISHGIPSFKNWSLSPRRWPVNNCNTLQIYLVTVKHMMFGQQRVFIQCCARCLTNVNTITIFTFDSSFSILSFSFLSVLEMERIGLWATLMLKLRRTFVTLSENPLA